MSLQHSVDLQLVIEDNRVTSWFLNFSSEIYRIFIILALIKCGKDWAFCDDFSILWGVWFVGGFILEYGWNVGIKRVVFEG